jgi:hypothetical protein
MSVPNPPTVGTAPSPAPTTQDTANFDARADAFHAFFPNWLNVLFPAVLDWIKARTEQVMASAVSVDTNTTAAANAATAAAASQTAAATSATSAGNSATAAASSQTAAAASAATASTGAATATTKATEASASAAAALASQTAAALSQTAAATSATESSASAAQALANRTASDASQAAAAASATQAATSANAPAWVSGTTYAVGVVTYSTLAKTTYRRIVAGAGTTDPSLDAVNWEPIGASLIALPGRTPLAQPNGMLHPSWAAALGGSARVNDIGVPGTLGFGVGVCPAVPADISAKVGTTDRLNDAYGNYTNNSDGSHVVWIPRFYMRIGHASNPTFATHGVNSIDIKSTYDFADEATANSQGYYTHRAFLNNGAVQQGFFRDKYDCSLTGGNTASSIPLAAPIVSGPGAGQTGFSACTANGQTPANNYSGAVQAARSRGAKWGPETIFMADALTRLSEAHAQAATSATHCAWYSAGLTNFPKGNNNNALRDTNDTAVQFTSAGAGVSAAFALAGSGVPFNKTTHNGQASGVADVNGNIYKINPGMTCIASGKAITAATQTNPVTLTVTAHGYTTGQVAMIEGVVGMTQINSRIYTITVINADTVSLDGVDGTAFPARTSGGTVTTGKFYALKPSANVETMTSGNTLATDYWGVNGVTANYDEVQINFATTYPNNSFDQRFGNAGNAAFGWTTSADRARSMLGMPAAGGVSPAGTAVFGNDWFYQYIRNELCVISRGHWSNGSLAGVRYRYLNAARTLASTFVGFAASRYL